MHRRLRRPKRPACRGDNTVNARDRRALSFSGLPDRRSRAGASLHSPLGQSSFSAAATACVDRGGPFGVVDLGSGFFHVAHQRRRRGRPFDAFFSASACIFPACLQKYCFDEKLNDSGDVWLRFSVYLSSAAKNLVLQGGDGQRRFCCVLAQKP